MEGNGYQVTWTYGHLCTLKEPDDYTPMWKRWSLSALPMIPQRFGIKLPKPCDRSVRIGKRLEIDQTKPFIPPSGRMESDSLVDLPRQALPGRTVGRGERPVVTERTPLRSDRSVPVGTAQAGIHRDLTHPAAEMSPAIRRVAVPGSAVAPRIDPGFHSERYKPQSDGL